MKQERRRFSQVIFAIAILHVLIYTVCCVHAPVQQFLIRDSINFGQAAPDQLSFYSESGNLFFSNSLLSLLALSKLSQELDFRAHSISLEQSQLLEIGLNSLKLSLRTDPADQGLADTIRQVSIEFASSISRTSAAF